MKLARSSSWWQRPSRPRGHGCRRPGGSRRPARCAPAPARGPYWPTMTLALKGSTAWVACKEQSRLLRLALPGGRRTAAVRLDAPVIAVAVGLGSVWALDSGSTLYRIDPRRARVTKRIPTGATAAYNIWIGAGAVWVADDQGARVLRISRSTNSVVARIPVGDGPADMVFAGSRAWAMTHRDNTLFGIDTATNDPRRLGSHRRRRCRSRAHCAAWRQPLDNGTRTATRRSGSRDRRDASLRRHRRDRDRPRGDERRGLRSCPDRRRRPPGLPTLTAVRRVTASGTVTTVATARGRVDVHGLALGLGSVWLADNTAGFLYRLST